MSTFAAASLAYLFTGAAFACYCVLLITLATGRRFRQQRLIEIVLMWPYVAIQFSLLMLAVPDYVLAALPWAYFGVYALALSLILHWLGLI